MQSQKQLCGQSTIHPVFFNECIKYDLLLIQLLRNKTKRRNNFPDFEKQVKLIRTMNIKILNIGKFIPHHKINYIRLPITKFS